MATKSNQPAPQPRVRDFILDVSQIQRDGAEVFGGLNVLRLNPGQGAAGLVITKIGTQTVKGRGKEKGKTRELPSYSATAPDGVEYRLPLNRSFVDKAVEAKLKVGDTITLICEGEYKSKEGNRGMGYTLLVTARAKK